MNFHEQIDRYLANEMNSEERSSFERELIQNEELQIQLTEHREAIQKLKNLERAYLKFRLQAIEVELNQDKPKKKELKFYWMIVVLLLLCVGYFIWKQKNKTVQSVYSPATNQTETDSNVNLLKKDIIPKDSLVNPKSEKKESLPQKKSIDREQLFAAHFEPYTDDDIEYEIRGNREKSTYELFKHFYINHKYDKALAVFENLDASDKTKEQVLFIKANILMATNKIDDALSILLKLKGNPQSVYSNDLSWYLGLCYIKKGEYSKARFQLIQLKGSHQSNAEMLLKLVKY